MLKLAGRRSLTPVTLSCPCPCYLLIKHFFLRPFPNCTTLLSSVSSMGNLPKKIFDLIIFDCFLLHLLSLYRHFPFLIPKQEKLSYIKRNGDGAQGPPLAIPATIFFPPITDKENSNQPYPKNSPAQPRRNIKYGLVWYGIIQMKYGQPLFKKKLKFEKFKVTILIMSLLFIPSKTGQLEHPISVLGKLTHIEYNWSV